MVFGKSLTIVFIATACAAFSSQAQDRARIDEGGDPSTSNAQEWQPLEEALQTAENEQRPVLVYVRADWCAPCYRLERDVFPRVERLLDGFITARVDLSDPQEVGLIDLAEGWIRRHGLDVPPSFAFLGPEGDLLASYTGFLNASELGELLHLTVLSRSELPSASETSLLSEVRAMPRGELKESYHHGAAENAVSNLRSGEKMRYQSREKGR